MNAYLPLYYTHVTCVVLSISLFVLRGLWMLAGSDMLSRRWVRVAPHLIDTVLLVSALALAWTIRQYPFAHDWLTVKVVALVVYIGLGMVALRRGPTKTIRATAYALAIATFGFMVSVAIYHHPAGIFWRLI